MATFKELEEILGVKLVREERISLGQRKSVCAMIHL